MTCCPQEVARLTERHRLRLRYGGGRPVTVKGPTTGISYRFSGIDQVQLVDPRDAIALVRSPMFRIEDVIELSTSNGASSAGGEGDYA